MHRTLRRYVGRTVVVDVDGAPLRGTLAGVDRAAVTLSGVEQDGAPIDGVIIVPLPVIMQVV